MPTTLCTLPLELLDTTLGFIDSPSDLLRLALACHLFLRLVVPKHLCYRELSAYCFVNAHVIWGHLLHSPRLAQNIRTLNIGVSTRSVVHIPEDTIKYSRDLLETFPKYDIEAAKTSFAGAMRSMNRLQTFVWKSTGGELRDDVLNDWMWPLLCASNASLRSLDATVKVTALPWDEPKTQESRNSVFDINTSRLEQLSLDFHTSPDLDDVLTSRMRTFFSRCSHLRALDLVFCWRDRTLVDLSAVFSDMHLPALQHISLANSLVRARPMERFLRRHPGLKSLHLVSGKVDIASIPTGLLPALESFETCHLGDVCHLARITVPQLQEIRMCVADAERLCGVRFTSICSGKPPKKQWYPLLMPFKDTLKRVVIVNDNLGFSVCPIEVAPGLLVVKRRKEENGYTIGTQGESADEALGNND